MLGELFLDHGTPATLLHRIFRVMLVLSGCAVVLGIGLSDLHKALRQASWQNVRCTILSSEVESVGSGLVRADPYHVHIGYRYRIGARSMTKLEEPDGVGQDDAAEAYAASRLYAVGMAAVCYVNPQNPSQSLLRRDSPVAAKLFVGGVSLVTLILVISYCLPQLIGYKKGPPQYPTKSKGLRTERASGVMLLLGFGAIFVHWYFIPMLNNWHSRSWIAVPAVVVESHILSIELGGEVSFTAYRTDIHYRYRFAGSEYHSNCYNLTEYCSLCESTHKACINAYPPGMRIVCYVNPHDPTRSVLTRHVSAGVLTGAWPAAAALLGASVLFKERAAQVLTRHRHLLVVVAAAVLLGMIGSQFATP